MKPFVGGVVWLSAATLFLSGCGGLAPKTVKVGSKNTAEHIILGEILAQVIEKKTQFKVDRRLGLGDTAIVHQAAISRDLDVFAEDTASAISFILKENAIMEPVALHERVRNEYLRQFGLQLTKPIGATAATVMVAPKTLAATQKVSSLSEAAAARAGWKLGMSEDFARRKEGFANLSTNYRLTQAEGPRTMDPANLYRALIDGQVNLVSALESDGMLADATLQVLTDDKRIFPPAQICFVVRLESGSPVAGLGPVLDSLAGRISTEDLRRAGHQVLTSNKPHAAVATELLARIGFN